MVGCDLQASFVEVLNSASKCRVLGPNNTEVNYVEDVAQQENVNANVWLRETCNGKHSVYESSHHEH